MDVQVRDDPDADRYVALVGGEPAGTALYERRGDVVVFTHTEVADAHEGGGVGSTLVREALDDVRRRGLSVRPRCPFVRDWIARHESYQDLLATG